MPRNAAAAAPAESATTPLEELLDRGRSLGHLSLDEVRKAFQETGITPAQGRSIIRELTDAGVRLASGDKAKTPPTKKKGTAAVKKAAPVKAAEKKSVIAAGSRDENTYAEKGPEQAAMPAEVGVAQTAESDDFDAPPDLDDQSSVMGDSVHTYLKAIGRRQLLTAAQEVDLAKRI
jgi:RNA polymerase primary sigma factor